MKVFCFVLRHFFFEEKGGAELQSFYLAQELINRGWCIHYVRDNEKMSNSRKVFKGINLHSIYTTRYIKKLNILEKYIRYIQLKLLIKKINPDVIYVRSYAPNLPLVYKISKNKKTKVIWAFASDNMVNKNNWENRYGKRFQYKLIEAFRNIDLNLFQTNYQKNLAQKNFNICGNVISNSHPIPKLKKIKRNKNVVWIGSLKKNKHPEHFIQVAKNLQEKGIEFILIGKPLGSNLLQLVQKADSELKIFYFLGELSSEDVHKKLSESKILINTSDFEGFSNTFIEAWLRGVPVISLKVDPDNIIENNKLGVVSQSLSKMSNDIYKLIENELNWKIMSKDCRDYAVKNFNIKNSVNELENLINNNEVLNGELN